MQEVGGEVDGPGVGRGRVADVGAAPDAPGGGQQDPGAGALDEGRLVPRSRRMPERSRFAHAEDAAAAEEPWGGRVQVGGVGERGPHLAHSEARARGVVVVAVGGGHRIEQCPRPLAAFLRLQGGQDGGHLDLRVEGNP